MACKFYNECTASYKDKSCSHIAYKNEYCYSYIEKERELFERNSKNPYWNNICFIADRQRKKGIQTYGQGLEKNQMNIQERLTYLEEELVDSLMYIEWIKDYLSNQR